MVYRTWQSQNLSAVYVVSFLTFVLTLIALIFVISTMSTGDSNSPVYIYQTDGDVLLSSKSLFVNPASLKDTLIVGYHNPTDADAVQHTDNLFTVSSVTGDRTSLDFTALAGSKDEILSQWNTGKYPHTLISMEWTGSGSNTRRVFAEYNVVTGDTRFMVLELETPYLNSALTYMPVVYDPIFDRYLLVRERGITGQGVFIAYDAVTYAVTRLPVVTMMHTPVGAAMVGDRLFTAHSDGIIGEYCVNATNPTFIGKTSLGYLNPFNIGIWTGNNYTHLDLPSAFVFTLLFDITYSVSTDRLYVIIGDDTAFYMLFYIPMSEIENCSIGDVDCPPNMYMVKHASTQPIRSLAYLQ